MADQLKFVESHNIAGYLMDPPAAHNEFKSMIAGLNNCRIFHALRANPVIRKDLITEFWRNASFKSAGADIADSMESTVQGKLIVVTEQTIREVLEFGDKLEFPTELPVAKVTEVLKRMSYEGVFPPTIKKLLPPYWRFLAHTFVSCISGRKGGSDEISQTATSAFVALTMDWEFNFSKFVFDEMRSNLTGKKKDLFLMYPRFLQMIFDSMHPELERTPETLDVKSLGPNTFGLMKQSRKASKVVFMGTEPLIKFGKFAETEGVQSTSTAIVAKEHVPPRSNLNFSLEVSDDDNDDDDEYVPVFETSEEPVNEAVISTAETKKEIDIFKQPDIPTTEHMDSLIESPSESEKEESDHSPLVRKRKCRDPRPGVLITEPIQQPDSNIDPTQDTQDALCPIHEEDIFILGGSSHESGSSSASQDPIQDPKDAALVKLAQFLAFEDSVPPTRGKGISIGSKQGSDEDTQQTISELKQEITILKQQSIEKDLLIGKLDVRVSELEHENSLKTKQISDLQANLGGLSTLYFDLKDKLIQKFGDNFQSSGSETQRDPATLSATEKVVVCPAPDSNIEQFLSSGPNTAEERREKQRKLEELKKGNMLLMKNSDQNAPGDQPQMFIKEVGKMKFADRYGDQSGVRMWGYEADKELWIVKRMSGNIEYYEKKIDFLSWTKVDLAELVHAPFHNSSNEPRAWEFKKFLENQSKKNFEDLQTAASFTKKVKGVIDPNTNKTMVNVMWPPTKKVKKIPFTQRVPDGTLNDMQFWVYDEETSTVVIRLKKNQIRIVDPRDLLRFGEHDIHTLSKHQIMVEKEIFETAAKVFTGMVAKIIEKRMCAGALADSDVHLVDTP